MIILRAYKTELDLNNEQRSACARHAGAARYAYNWGLRRKIEAYEAGERTPTAIDLHRELNTLKQSELAWMYEVSKCAPQEALRNLDRAFDHFFRRVALKKQGQFKGAVGFPRFKSRKHGLGSFRLTGSIHVFEDSIQLPRLGRLRLHEKGYLLSMGGKILSATVSEKAGRWFVSVSCEIELPDPPPATGEPLGVDLGLKTLAVVSDGREFDNPRALNKAQQKMRRLQRELAGRKKGSGNREKTRHKIAKLHARIANVRKDALHQATSAIVKARPKPSVIVLEDLNVAGMVKNHSLARAISDVGMAEFARQVNYKAAWNGVEVRTASRFFPSSKLCSVCGCINDNLTLADREWDCVCGAHHSRDLNAARNLAQCALDPATAGSRQPLLG